MPVGGNALYLASKKFLKNTKESLSKITLKLTQIKYYIKKVFLNLIINNFLYLI